MNSLTDYSYEGMRRVIYDTGDGEVIFVPVCPNCMPVALIYDREPRQCNHCGVMNRGVYLVGNGVLCYKCYGQYLEDPDPSFWGPLLQGGKILCQD